MGAGMVLNYGLYTKYALRLVQENEWKNLKCFEICVVADP